MPYPLILFLLFVPLPVFACFLFVSFLCPTKKTTLLIPPGPRPFPIIGNLHLMGPLPHRGVAKLSKIYGPILYLRLGSVPTIFVSSPCLAEKVLKSNDIFFANRPYSEVAEFLSYGYKGFSFSEYGTSWREIRKLCVHNLLNQTKLDSYAFIRREELANFIRSLQDAAKARAIVDVTVSVRMLVTDIVCRVIMGRKCEEKDGDIDAANLSELIHEMMTLLGSFNLSDFVPALRPFDLQGMRRRVKAVKKPLDRFFEDIIDEHEVFKEEGNMRKEKDFIDAMLDSTEGEDCKLKIDRDNIKAILMEIFGGTMHTSPVSIEWAFIELLRNPKALKKAQEELNAIVGPHRMVDESDLSKLTYLEMVVKESFRLHHVGPFLLHHSKVGFNLDGYYIPKGSNVMVCAWAMGHDPKLWPSPEEFRPERFEKINIGLRGQDFQLLPFGSGRRGCAGMGFGLLVLPLVLAQLVHCFDWELPGGMSPLDLDMRETLGLAMPRTVHLHAIPVNRLIEG